MVANQAWIYNTKPWSFSKVVTNLPSWLHIPIEKNILANCPCDVLGCNSPIDAWGNNLSWHHGCASPAHGCPGLVCTETCDCLQTPSSPFSFLLSLQPKERRVWHTKKESMVSFGKASCRAGQGGSSQVPSGAKKVGIFKMPTWNNKFHVYVAWLEK